ncbi:MAG: Gfo/Idh/MocA family oxidoreductase [Armatimonadota bacterium]|nr:Gfo/Idh/MocA family oxidoreductase [Armatimonadota bacterium]MCX7777705.1 Gfo/Idh/MocA family oxidoreductase [Armatimonadota bacterium]MDW8025464.1 Gfo/Idh/MocA family oxidoreductase [Armatimonadota bacterium]
MDGKVRVAVIGAGQIAQAAHLPNFKAHSNAELVAICDIVKERAQRTAIAYGIEHVYDDYRELLKRDDIDAVCISLPTNLHAEVAIAALNSGKHVLCEKPPARNAKEAQRMAEASESNSRLLMYALQWRYRADSKLARKLVEDGELGEIYYGRTACLRRRGAPLGWFASKEAGGGALLDVGVHLIDLAWWLMGNPEPMSASGATYTKIALEDLRPGGWQPADVKEGIKLYGEFEVEELATGMIRFANGATLSFEIAWMLNIKGESTLSLDIYGTRAGMHLPPLELYRDIGGYAATETLGIDPGNPYKAEVEHFIECILEGKKPLTDAWQGVTVMRMLDAIYRSARDCREAKLSK